MPSRQSHTNNNQSTFWKESTGSATTTSCPSWEWACSNRKAGGQKVTVWKLRGGRNGKTRTWSSTWVFWSSWKGTKSIFMTMCCCEGSRIRHSAKRKSIVLLFKWSHCSNPYNARILPIATSNLRIYFTTRAPIYSAISTIWSRSTIKKNPSLNSPQSRIARLSFWDTSANPNKNISTPSNSMSMPSDSLYSSCAQWVNSAWRRERITSTKAANALTSTLLKNSVGR
jgi:hypothetical protein